MPQIISGPKPVPPFSRMMAFIDGENLVCRYKAMLKEGYSPYADVSYEDDVFVWRSGASLTVRDSIVLRSTYYTYATGTDEHVHAIQGKLKNLTFPKHHLSTLPDKLYPQVFKKTNRQAKKKGVDIQMTVDILTHTFQNNLDVVYLFSGDGDYKPIIETVIRNGKQLYLAAFSSGLNPDLKNLVDNFTCLDSVYFEKDPQGNPIS